jgi:hypothetical protein
MKKLLFLLLLAPVLGFGQVLSDILYYDVEQQLPVQRMGIDDERNERKYFINGEVKNGLETENPNEYNFFTVPDGKLWQVKKFEYMSSRNGNYFSASNYLGWEPDVYYKTFPDDRDWFQVIFFNDDDFTNKNMFSFYPDSHNSRIDFLISDYDINDNLFFKGGTKFTFVENYFRVIIYEYSLDGNSLSYNETETIKNKSNTPILFPNPTSSLLTLNSDKEYNIEVYDMAGNKVMALTGNTIDMSHLSSATYIVKALDKVENEEVSYKVVKN